MTLQNMKIFIVPLSTTAESLVLENHRVLLQSLLFDMCNTYFENVLSRLLTRWLPVSVYFWCVNLCTFSFPIRKFTVALVITVMPEFLHISHRNCISCQGISAFFHWCHCSLKIKNKHSEVLNMLPLRCIV